MEHPDVIREIDALIDSYNWEGLPKTSDGMNIPLALKNAMRNRDACWDLEAAISRFPALKKFVLVQLLLKILAHPRLADKQWVFILLFSSRHWPKNHTVSGKMRHILDQAIPLLTRLLNHRKALYRLYASGIIARLEYSSDVVVGALLARLQREPSPFLRCVIANHLASVVRRRSGRGLADEARQNLLIVIKDQLKASDPATVISMARIALRVVSHKDLASIFENVFEIWPRINNRLEQAIGSEFIMAASRIRHPDIKKQLISLLARSQHHALAEAALKALLYDPKYEYYGNNQRYIAITAQQKTILETAIACRALWAKSTRRQAKGYYGFEPTRSALRQQLKHARIIDETEQFTQPQLSFPLILMQN
jgi:hypothetical protein